MYNVKILSFHEVPKVVFGKVAVHSQLATPISPCMQRLPLSQNSQRRNSSLCVESMVSKSHALIEDTSGENLVPVI